MGAVGSHTDTVSSLTGDLLVFQLCGHICAVPARKVQEIVPMALLAQPPGLPSLLEGFLNLRGMAMPVLRLARLFDLPALAPGLYSPIILLRGNLYPLGLLVDAVTGIVSPPADGYLPVGGKNCFNDCAQAEVVLNNHTVHLLSCERLLLEKERQCVAEFQARAQQYLQELEALSV